MAALDQAHRLGFAGAFLFDHLWPLGQPGRPALECWTLLAALAARLGSIDAGAGVAGSADAGAGAGSAGERGAVAGPVAPFRLGTLVTRAGLRSPALLAHMAATVAQVAGGTLIVGLGMGDAANRTENQAFGLPYHDDPLKRAAELVRSVAALRGAEVPGDPQPGGGPGAGGAVAEVWVGGGSHRARGLAGRLAEAWNGWGLTPEELAAGLVEVRRAAEEAGRDPAGVTGTWGGQVLVGEDAAEARALLARWGAHRPAEDVGRTVVGDPAAVAARLAELGGAGATWCVIAPVGGPAAAMRALLAEAASLTPRMVPERADG